MAYLAALADLSVDVALTSAARGDLLYRGASKWNNLAAGTSGKLLQSNGAGADPSWVTVDLTTLVTLTPATPTRNTITPSADANAGLLILPFSATQSAGLLGVGPDPGGASAWVVAGTSALVGLLVQPPAGITPGTGVPFLVQDRSGNQILGVTDTGAGGAAIVAQCNDPADNALVVRGAAGQTASIFTVAAAGFPGILDVGLTKIGFFGATAAVRQATASAAGIAGIRTDTLAHAVADIQTILTALRAPGVTFGLTANTA